MDKATDLAIRKQVSTVPKALAALTALRRELTAAKTYDAIKKIIREAEALNVLLGHVVEVKAAAEDTILLGTKRIAVEIRKIPKASGRPEKNRRAAKNSGREATGIPKDTRSRIGKLADVPDEKILDTAADLRAHGKDGTPRAVIETLTQGNKRAKRAAREEKLAARITALPDRRYGVIVADPEWRFEPWSRNTGMDRAADNHYPTSVTEVIAARDVASIAAPDCVLFLWGTAPMMPHALCVMAAWGFDYRTHFVWRKDRIGTGYWNRNRHELLLVGVVGDVPAPVQGSQWDSVIDAARDEHSAKPDIFLEMVEAYFPTVPKIELNRRGTPRVGWDAWGNEVEEAAA